MQILIVIFLAPLALFLGLFLMKYVIYLIDNKINPLNKFIYRAKMVAKNVVMLPITFPVLFWQIITSKKHRLFLVWVILLLIGYVLNRLTT